jgi:transposase InsO family protein
LNPRFSVEWLCQLFGVSRSGYYKWLKRRGKLNRYQIQQRKLDRLVQPIHEKHPSLGYHAIGELIRDKIQYKCCDSSVLRSMQRLGLKSRAKPKRYTHLGHEHKVFPNILARKFRSAMPFEKIVTDITLLKHKGKRYYLACYLDLFNNEILEWNISEKEDNFLVLKPLQRLLKRKRMNTNTPLVLHSDQGVQYISASFTSLLERYNITQSMSRAGNPRDNAVMESFFGWFKCILEYDFKYRNTDDLVKTIGAAIDYYNNERPSYALKYKSPVQYRIERGYV